MERMAAVIKREKLKLLDRLETSHMTLTWPCLIHSLYGKKDDSDLADFVDDIHNLDIVANFDNATWVTYLREYFIDAKRATIIGKPSAEHAAKQAEDEEKRIEEQRKSLGEDKLKQLEKELEKHRAQNDIPVPAEIFGKHPARLDQTSLSSLVYERKRQTYTYAYLLYLLSRQFPYP